tara:strand:- start:4182 stop:5153 length:972 start_codon:yes stop_codon:yes gene_type:complete
MKLTIAKDMVKKIKYLLNEFPGNEWSGPAFYEVKFGKNGFPTHYELKYFKPIDLGGKVDTEFSGELLNSFIPKIWVERPETKQYACGLIHSHHSMGAYFSKTDTDQMEESIKDSKAGEDTFYPSLVVSYAKGKEYHFGIAYKDNYGYISIVEALKKNIKELGKKSEHPKEWVDEVNYIVEEDKKKKRKKFANHTYTRNSKAITTYPNQRTIFQDMHYSIPNMPKTFMEKLPRELNDNDKELISSNVTNLGNYIKVFNEKMWGLEEVALVTMEEIIDKAETKGIVTEDQAVELTNDLYDIDFEEEISVQEIDTWNKSFGGNIAR